MLACFIEPYYRFITILAIFNIIYYIINPESHIILGLIISFILGSKIKLTIAYDEVDQN